MNNFRNPPRAEIVGLLERSHTIAVVGLSDDPARPSYGVSRSMRSFGYRIVPVNPSLEVWEGLPAYPSLDAAAGMTVVMDRCIYVDRSAMFER